MIQKIKKDKDEAPERAVVTEEDYIFQQEEGVEIDGMLEIYLRMNDDMEKDYCFNVKVSDRFRNLYKIFETLPVLLTPSVFYNPKPVGFYVSTNPGYLTRSGSLLFSYEAGDSQYLLPVEDEDKISDKIWPGQLIIPKWEINYNRIFAVFSILGLWLYTDLPDFISPTPGICLTNQVSKFLSYLALKYLHNERLASDLMSEVVLEYGMWGQLGFFAMHIVKVIIIFLVVYLGIFNPYKFELSIFTRMGKAKLDVTKEQLVEIGWTSAKKATIDEFMEVYREYAIEKAGGLINANKSGVFKQLRKPGVNLEDGEGFSTKLPVDEEDKGINAITLAKMRKMDEFKLNYDYIACVGEFFEKQLEKSAKPGEDIKKFRRFGPFELPDELKEIVLKRVERDGVAQLLKE